MTNQNNRWLLRVLLLLRLVAPARLCAQAAGAEHASDKPSRPNVKAVLRTQDEEFYLTDEARRVGDQLLAYQRVTGGWPKNIDMARPLSEEEMAQVMGDKKRRDDSTTDNDATNMQMIYLARLYNATHDGRYRDAVQRGVDYLLSGQYANGGWPQFWPEMRGYQIHITYNDNAMVNTMLLLRQVADAETPFNGQVVDRDLRHRSTEAFDNGVEGNLNKHILHDGELTVWCQQHDRETLLPAPARAYELPSYCSSESASIVSLLMSLPKPTERVKQAVHAAMRWFDRYKLTGLRVVREIDANGMKNTRLVSDSTGHVIWARFYDLQRCEPFVCDRDGIPRRHLEEIGAERRNGYAWYVDRPADLFEQYKKWAAKHDPQNAVVISLDSKGANETGLTSERQTLLLSATATADTRRDSLLSVITGAQRTDMPAVSITKYGAKGDGTTDCRRAFQRAMKDARRRGGMHLVVPRGVYFIAGPLNLESHVWLELQDGATLRFSPDPACYLPAVETSWEGTYLYNYSPMIYCRNVTDVAITGDGIIDGNSAETFGTWRPQQAEDRALTRTMNHNEIPVSERRFGEGHLLRPQLVQFYQCSGITIDGIRITNAPFWCIHILNSSNVVCRALAYSTHQINNDGIDIESSSDVLIEDISFDNGDDNIAIKSGRDNDGWRLAQPSRNIIIRNCRFQGLHALVIGSEMSGGVEDVWVEHCGYAGYCKRGIYVKTNPNRGGYVRRLTINDVTFGEIEDLFYITSAYGGEGMDDTHYSDISDILVDGLSASKCNGNAVVVQGTPQLHVRNVTLQNIDVPTASCGISIEHADNVNVSNCFIGGHAGVPSHK